MYYMNLVVIISFNSTVKQIFTAYAKLPVA